MVRLFQPFRFIRHAASVSESFPPGASVLVHVAVFAMPGVVVAVIVAMLAVG